MKRIFFFAFLIFNFYLSSAQSHPPFWTEIQAFKRADSAAFPPKNSILFIGSSSFRMWQQLQNDFPGFTIINRGFGGSSLPDVIRYEKDIIFPYAPKQVLIYCGDNDFAASDTVTVQTVFRRFVQLFSDIRSHLPQTAIAFVSIKPSPSRRHLMPKMELANRLIEAFLKKQPNTQFIDIYHPMLLANGQPIPELFLSDSLHMTRKGYEIWKREIGKALIK